METTGKKFLYGLLSILPVIIGIVIQLGVTMVAMTIYMVYRMGSSTELATDPNFMLQIQKELSTPGMPSSILTMVVIGAEFIVFALWYFILVRKEDKSHLKVSMNIWNIVKIILLAATVQLTITLLLNVILPYTGNVYTEYMKHMEGLVGAVNIPTIITTVLLAPIAEECMFRGITMKMMEKYAPLMAANILQAALFGLYHMQLVQGIYAFVIGLVLGYVAIKTKSILTTILLHMGINGLSFIVDSVVTEDMLSHEIICIVAAVIFAVVSIVIMKYIKGPEEVAVTN